MAQRKFPTVLGDFLQNLQECRRIAADAYQWSPPGAHGTHPHISARRRDSLTEMAFLRAFLAWEDFIEEAFILYLTGRVPPRGRPPKRYAFPLNYKMALNWVSEGREYARWTSASEVRGRAERYFHAGRPFSPVLAGNQNLLDEVQTIRNAIAHRSTIAREKFETLVRKKPGTLPPYLTVGGFLSASVPGSAPPLSFLEFYVGKIEFAAQEIVPS